MRGPVGGSRVYELSASLLQSDPQMLPSYLLIATLNRQGQLKRRSVVAIGPGP